MKILNLKRICPLIDDVALYAYYEGEIEGKEIGTLVYSPIFFDFSPESKKILEELGYNIDELKINVIKY